MKLLTWSLSALTWESFSPSSLLPPLRNCIFLDLWFLCQLWLISSFNYFSRFLSILLSVAVEQLFPFFLSLYFDLGGSRKHLIILVLLLLLLSRPLAGQDLRNGCGHVRF